MKNIGMYLRNIIQAEYHKVDKRLEKYNLVKGQASLLSLIKKNDGATQNELADLLNVRYSSMSERLYKLEIMGYIRKAVAEENQKYKRIFITTEGKKAVIQCNRILNEFEESLYKGFTKKELKQLEDSLEKIMKNIERMQAYN
jgi:DNA-binding MarR family transcriptional regulator